MTPAHCLSAKLQHKQYRQCNRQRQKWFRTGNQFQKRMNPVLRASNDGEAVAPKHNQ